MCGAGGRPFTPILRSLQYYIFSVGSCCHSVLTSYPPSTFIAFISCMIYLCPVPILTRIGTSYVIQNLKQIIFDRIIIITGINMLGHKKLSKLNMFLNIREKEKQVE